MNHIIEQLQLSGFRLFWAARLLFFGLLASGSPMALAVQVDIPNPGSGQAFGYSVDVLQNGNIVITDNTGNYVYGSVYLFSPSGELISTLGKALYGGGGVHLLGDGNFVVCTPYWAPPPVDGVVTQEVGAVTWVNGTTGLNGDVSASNSLVGTQPYDRVCAEGVSPLQDGKYVVLSRSWNNGEIESAGAATLCAGKGACVGEVNSSNSLVGTSPSDWVGSAAVVLSNGNYVVSSPYWSRDGVVAVGAATLCSSETGCGGESVSTTNSLVGSAAYDLVSLGGSQYLDQGYPGIVSLDDGNFVVVSPYWAKSGIANAGAITLVNGVSGKIGVVSMQNSLFGNVSGDFFGAFVTPLLGGNYVVSNSAWDNAGVADAGASTWCAASTGCVGEVNAGNSLIGTIENEHIGGLAPATALSDGNYVVSSSNSGVGGVYQAGAATWCDGSMGCTGFVSLSNSLVGSFTNDLLGSSGITALSDGSYVVNSEWWDNGGMADLGASLLCRTAGGCVGTVSSAYSLTGAVEGDRVGGALPAIALTNGNYVVNSNFWQGDGVVGALTWVDGRRGLVGHVSAENSFVGIDADYSVGGPRIFSLPNGNFVSTTRSWANGSTENAGAITLLRGYGPQLGTVNSSNSVIGTLESGGYSLNYDYDVLNDTLVVGKPLENIVTLLRVDQLFFNGLD